MPSFFKKCFNVSTLLPFKTQKQCLALPLLYACTLCTSKKIEQLFYFLHYFFFSPRFIQSAHNTRQPKESLSIICLIQCSIPTINFTVIISTGKILQVFFLLIRHSIELLSHYRAFLFLKNTETSLDTLTT